MTIWPTTHLTDFQTADGKCLPIPVGRLDWQANFKHAYRLSADYHKFSAIIDDLALE